MINKFADNLNTMLSGEHLYYTIIYETKKKNKIKTLSKGTISDVSIKNV